MSTQKKDLNTTQKELYYFCEDKFEEKIEALKQINGGINLIPLKHIVKEAIELYTNWYSTPDAEIFTNDDFNKVVEALANEYYTTEN